MVGKVAHSQMDVKSATEEEDLLDGVDLEGVSEEEKAQIKQAILASRQDQPNPRRRRKEKRAVSSDDEEQGTAESDAVVAESTVDDDADTQEPAVTVNGDKGTSEMSEPGSEPDTVEPGVSAEDDETQPPSQEIDEGELDLSKSTQVMADEVSAYQLNTDIDDDPNKSQTSDDVDASSPPQNIQAVPSPQVAMDTSQGSGGFSPQPEGSKSAGSPGSQDQGPERDNLRLRKSKSNSQGEDGEQTECPLHRHYRAVRRKAAPRDQYFGMEGMTTEQCAKAIYQLFETYRTKLREAQRKLYPKLDWGDPIKTGQHLSKTIDVKKRGQTSVYLEVSDDDNDIEMEEIKSSRRARKAVSNSDDDFENEIIKPRRRGQKATYQSDDELQTKRNNRYKRNVDEEFMSAETQDYYVGQSASTSDMKTVQEEPGSLRRRLRNRKGKVLVEDTQLPELSKKDYRAGTQSQFIVEETQEAEDDLIDYLSVKKDNHAHARKQTFENPMQQAKLKCYTIPMRKKESSEEKWENLMQQDRKRENVQRSGSHESVGEDSERKATTARGRARKGKKEPVTLVEETQDMMDDFPAKVNAKAGVRQKRKCFDLSSDSEEESVPETQGMEGSPEVVIIEEKTSPKMRKKTTERPKVLTATVIGNVVPKDEPEDIDDPDSDKDSQSPVIKRSSRFKNKPVKNAMPKKKAVTIEEKNLHEQLGEVKDETEQAGVKRLFSRPQSKESAASDDVSLASSQISNTALDESGDLYSTQIFGVGQTVRNNKRDVNQNVKIKPDKPDKMKRFDEILDTDSDEEVLIVKEVKKTFSKKVPNIGHTRREATKHKTGQNEPSISKYFTSGKVKDDDQRNVKPKKRDPMHLVDVNVNQNDSDSDEDPLSSEARASVYDHPVKKTGSTKVPSVELEDIYFTVKKDPETLNERGKHAKPKHDIYVDEEQPPISLNDFTKQEMSRSAAADQAVGGARPKTKRQRKPVTVTIIDDEPDVRQRHREPGPHVGVADNIVGGARRRGRRARHEEEAEEEEEEPIPKAAKMEEPTIQCPLCGVKFATSVIEQHASNCDGTPPDEQENAAAAGHQPQGNRNQGMAREAGDMSDENPLMGDDSPMRVNDTSVDDVLRDIRSSPGENGEVEQCYICDQYVSKGQEFQQHINQCMQRAKHQQEEVDSKGFVDAFQLPDESEPEIRQTRGRYRHNKDVPVAIPVVVKPVRGVVRGTGRGVTHTATRGQKEDGYSSGPSVSKESSESESETGSSSCEEGSSSSCVSDDDDNITLGSLARAGSSRPVHPQTQSDGSNPIPDWLKRSADSPIKSFVPTSMQQNSEYFNKQFAYNEKRVAERQKKRKRTAGKPKRRKRRKVRRKKKT